MQSKSVIFFGTDEIGSCVLEKLINLKANIIAVVTRADKPSGRNKKICTLKQTSWICLFSFR